jgi:hypothetical protein
MLRYLDVCRFGEASMLVYSSLHPELQRLFMEAIRCTPRHLDFGLICGHRGPAAQAEALRTGHSTKPWPESEHNSLPSNACEIRPASPFKSSDWEDKARFGRIVGLIECISFQIQVPVRCGLDWNGDGRSIDERFPDLGHIERRKKSA